MDKATFHRTPEFGYRISMSLIVGLVLLVVMIIGASFLVIWFEGRPRLAAMDLDSQTKLGQNISLAMEVELQGAAGVARSIASSVISLPSNARVGLLPKLVPGILNASGTRNMYVGGGVWPEPFAFDPDRQRAGIFRAQSAVGELNAFSDHSAPQGLGYLSQEWYVAPRVFGGDEVYWSKLYRDPSSQQLIVTCSAAMIEGGNFKGVSTVDLEVGGISKTLNQLITGLNAYAFIVDRNNRFVVFPTLGFDVSRTQTYSGNNGFEYLSDLVRIYPAFEEIDKRLRAMDSSLYDELKTQKPSFLEYVSKLVEGSGQIEQSEAEHIVSLFWWNKKVRKYYPKPLETFKIRNDLLLRGEATGFIYQMPSTHWRIVTVFERKSYGTVSEALSRKLFGAILFCSVIFGVCAFVLMKLVVINRITRMVNLLSQSVQHSEKSELKLDYDKKDELGLLTYWFNRRSEQLGSAVKAAKRANKAKSDFLTAMSHELKTPLNSIIGFNRRLIVKLGGDLDEQNYKTLIAIQRSSNHLLSLIDDINEVSELEAGKVQLKYDWESVNLLLDDAGSQMSGQIADAGINFEITPLLEDVRIYVDRQKIIQILLHLLSNALQATGSGQICLKVERDQLAEYRAVAFSVVDTGAGMSNEDKHRIFRQFTQVEEYNGLDEGIGLGLYLIREITALHSGAVFFNAEVNVGSEFKVVIPVSANLSKDKGQSLV